MSASMARSESARPFFTEARMPFTLKEINFMEGAFREAKVKGPDRPDLLGPVGAEKPALFVAA